MIRFVCACIFTFHFRTRMGTRVYIGRLSNHCRERDVERFFKGYGRLKDVMLKNGYGFVVGICYCKLGVWLQLVSYWLTTLYQEFYFIILNAFVILNNTKYKLDICDIFMWAGTCTCNFLIIREYVLNETVSFMMYKMQLVLVMGPLVYSHGQKQKWKSTCLNGIRVTENRFFVPFGFKENLVTIDSLLDVFGHSWQVQLDTCCSMSMTHRDF